MEAGKHHLCTCNASRSSGWVPSLHFPSNLLQLADSSQQGVCILLLAPHFLAAAQGTPVHQRALSGGQEGVSLLVPQTITKGEQVLQWLAPPGHSKRQQSKEPSLSVKEAYLFASLHRSGQRGRLLIKHISKGLQ